MIEFRVEYPIINQYLKKLNDQELALYDLLVKYIVNELQVDYSRVFKDDRHKEFRNARNLMRFWMKIYTKASLELIGNITGTPSSGARRVNHSTVLNSIRKWQLGLDNNEGDFRAIHKAFGIIYIRHLQEEPTETIVICKTLREVQKYLKIYHNIKIVISEEINDS